MTTVAVWAGSFEARAEPAADSVVAFSSGRGKIPEAWEPMTFPKVKQHTRYVPVRETGDDTWVLEATSDGAASGLMHRVVIDLSERPILRWRWKVAGVLERGDAHTKAGDDYAARVYLIFDPPSRNFSFLERAALGIARGIYGEVPGRAISYIWASRLEKGKAVDSAYVGGFAKLLAVRSGTAEAGRWHTEVRDVAADYRALFGTEAVPVVGVAIMTDSDDTQENAHAWYGDIEFVSREAAGSSGNGTGS